MLIVIIDSSTQKIKKHYTESTITFGSKYFHFLDVETGEYLQIKLKYLISITKN